MVERSLERITTLAQLGEKPRLSQTIVQQTDPKLENSFSVGICAADRATKLKELLDIIKYEPYPSALLLESIVIVGSGLNSKSTAFLRGLGRQGRGLVFIEEPIRRGKAEAINRIIDTFTGQFLVLVNSDAQPERGAISKLLSIITADSRVGMVSASPVLDKRSGVTGAVLQLMWSVHNECLLALNREDQNNHCCDELIVLRSDAIRKLPHETVNDGAYLAGAAYKEGYSIRFCDTAHVRIDVPGRLCDVLRQRRRIVYGHLQIRRVIGESPRTMESMLVGNPRLSLAILVRTVRKAPRTILALPIAVVGEAISVVMALIDTITPKAKHVPWLRFASRS
jgi:cellulose synthase/poly-beta-1,6-N-acetylglucosamine synthase-like glycosyltransferase